MCLSLFLCVCVCGGWARQNLCEAIQQIANNNKNEKTNAIWFYRRKKRSHRQPETGEVYANATVRSQTPSRVCTLHKHRHIHVQNWSELRTLFFLCFIHTAQNPEHIIIISIIIDMQCAVSNSTQSCNRNIAPNGTNRTINKDSDSERQRAGQRTKKKRPSRENERIKSRDRRIKIAWRAKTLTEEQQNQHTAEQQLMFSVMHQS